MKRTSPLDSRSEPPVLRLSRPDDLIEAVPYLVGFHPRDSLVLVGFAAGRPGDLARGMKTVVTVVARLDLADVDASHEAVENAVRALTGSRSASAVALVYMDVLADALARIATINSVESACAQGGLTVGNWIFVGDDRWAMGAREDGGFVFTDPVEHAEGSLISATATYAGLVARPDRAALAELLAPQPAEQRELLLPALTRAQRDRQDCSAAARERSRRSDIRALFAATRTLAMIDASQTVRFGAALADIDVRDACWLAIEAGRIEGEGLWRELSRTLPDAYRAPALFLFGWQQWRAGAGALAGIAVDAALACDPTYHAADLLDGALAHGLDPFRTPRLRKDA